MPVTYEIDGSARIVRVELAGEATLSEYEGAATRLWSSGAAISGYGMLIRAPDLKRLPVFSDVRALVRIARDFAVGGVAPIAIAASGPAQFSVARMFQGAASIADLDVGVFMDEAAAVAWIDRRRQRETPPQGVATVL